MSVIKITQIVSHEDSQLRYDEGRFLCTIMRNNKAIKHITKKTDKEATGLFWGVRNDQDVGVLTSDPDFAKGYKEGLGYFKQYGACKLYTKELLIPYCSYSITRKQLLTVLLPRSIWFKVSMKIDKESQVTIDNPELDCYGDIRVLNHDTMHFTPPSVRFNLPKDGFQIHHASDGQVAITNKDWDYYLVLSDTELAIEILEHMLP